MSIDKAVFPAAGLGTRFLPATKALPKEMLPIVDKPAIQYVVEEAIESEIKNIIIITGRGKRAIEDHFDISYELEATLQDKGKERLYERVREISHMISVAYVRQKQALGLGHAVLVAKNLVGREPFAVLLGDDIIESETPCLKQLIDVYEKYKAPVIAVMEVPEEETSRYGIVAGEEIEDRIFKITDMVEKPEPGSAPSRLAIIGRYIAIPEIFDYLEKTRPGSGGEIQFTDAIKSMLRSHPIYALRFRGTRHDTGDKLGYLKTMVSYGLKNREVGAEFKKYLSTLDLS